MCSPHTRVAVFVDLSFFLVHYARREQSAGRPLDAAHAARAVCTTARAHIGRTDELHRIFVYDCRPLAKKAHNPVSGRSIDFAKTSTYAFRSALLAELTCKRKVVLRLGELADRRRWLIRPESAHKLLNGSMHLHDLQECDVAYDIEQKGVDIKLGLDVATLAYKKLVDRIVLITGDSDFVPAAKLARREGLDVILDPLWAPIAASLNEHIDGLRTSWNRETRISLRGSART